MLSRILAIVVLLLLNGFFVAVEFALVRSRRTRLEAMTRAGAPGARSALRAIANLPRVLSASQLGITLASLGLGFVAEATLAETMKEWFATLPIALEVSLRVTAGATLALVVVTYFHVVFGELAPRAAALNHPEQVARFLSPPLLAFAWVVTPFTWVLNRSSQVVLRAFGQRPDFDEESVHSPDELRMLVEQSQERGAIERQDAEFIEGVFEFSEKNAREVMTPRTAIVALAIDAPLEEALETVVEGGFSRYPVYEETIDDIVGIVLAKDLLAVVAKRLHEDDSRDFALGSAMRKVHVVPGTREVEEVLGDFKRLKEHMAVVLDEFGGTAGIVTMEDLLEEIVGEILDEHDEPAPQEGPSERGETFVAGSVHVAELNERFGLEVPEDDYTTIGGYVFGVLGRLPVPGDRVTSGGAIFVVRQMEGRRIAQLAVDLHTLGDRRATAREDGQPDQATAGEA